VRPSPPLAPAALSSDIIAACYQLGFAAAGVCEATPTSYRSQLIAWLDSGKHGSMGYLQEHLPARLDLGLILPDARSAIMVADSYACRGDADPPVPDDHGRIARYARGRDYHKVMKQRLHSLCDALRAQHPGHEFRAFVDTAPIPEREYAARARLGWTGKHTLLIAPPTPHSRGSYMLLGGILTTLELAPAPAPEASTRAAVAENHCSTCTRCIDACPTQAISPFSVDARRCISYLTIERREPIAPEFHDKIGNWLYGCDICQEVCPHNAPISSAPASSSSAILPDYTPRFATLNLLEILDWSDADRAVILSGSAMKRATLPMLKRNALIVLVNQALAPGAQPGARAGLVERCRAILHSTTEPQLLRDTARQSLQRLEAQPL
jgi:epoxyqueuosine reductase